MYKRIGVIIFSLLSLLPLTAQSKYEVRAAWLTTIYGLDWPSEKATGPVGIKKQKQELCSILDQLKAANFNTILLQTRLRADVIYPSAIEPFNFVLTGRSGKNPGYDPLAFAIEECHKRGLEIHAWIVAIPLGGNRHIKTLGESPVTKLKPHLCKQYQGEWYLDPGHPGTKDYLFSIIKEITTNYDIDGIHLDYIRYPDKPKSFPDKDLYGKYGKGFSLEQWRRENINAIVRHIYHGVKALKPWVKVSSSPLGKFRDTSRYSSHGWNAYHTVYQDAQGWLEEGIMDMVFPMLYFDNNQFYPFVLDWQEKSSGRQVIPGLGIYFLHPSEKNWSLGSIERQINFIRKHGLAGQAYYRTKHILDNTKGILDKLHQEFYISPALVPPMTWIDSLPPSPPNALQFKEIKGDVFLEWNSSATFNEKVYYNIYSADSYPIDITNPDYIISSRLNTTTYQYSCIYPTDRMKYFAVTTFDRYGKESDPVYFNPPSSDTSKFINDSVLYLPPSLSAAYLTITDISGRNILTTPYQQDIRIENLEKGHYRIFITDENGKCISVRNFIK